MIGVVTHSYPNGSFIVFFAEGRFGAKGFSKAVPDGERLEPGDRVECDFSPGGQGTVIRAVRVQAQRPGPKAEAGLSDVSARQKPVLRMRRRPAADAGDDVAGSAPQDVSWMDHHVK